MVGFRVGVDADVAEVGAEGRLEVAPGGVVERLPGAALGLNRLCDAVVDATAAITFFALEAGGAKEALHRRVAEHGRKTGAVRVGKGSSGSLLAAPVDQFFALPVDFHHFAPDLP